MNIVYLLAAIILTDNLLPFLFSATISASQKGKASKMIETNVEVSIRQSHKWLEKALQELQRAKQRVANEKKKQNEKKRKVENHTSTSWAALS
ncbi:MAG: hypothetical protein NC429_15030 [Lachnospiraceae bacterium]|nr:hypothetical protein [Lachnospiraceae bacterium]